MCPFRTGSIFCHLCISPVPRCSRWTFHFRFSSNGSSGVSVSLGWALYRKRACCFWVQYELWSCLLSREPKESVEAPSSFLGGLFNLKDDCFPTLPNPPSCLDSVTSSNTKYNSVNRWLCIQKINNSLMASDNKSFTFKFLFFFFLKQNRIPLFNLIMQAVVTK